MFDLIGGASISVIILVILAVLTVMKSVVTVRQGYEYTVERFGRFTRTMRPGIHFLVPYIDSIGAKVNVMERVLEVPSQEVITKDNAVVGVDGVVFFQVLDAAKASYEVNNLENAVLNLTMTNVRTVLGSMDLDESLSKRDAINAALLSVVDTATTPWGIKVTRIEIKDITPILEAEGEKEAAFRNAEAREREAEAEANATRMVSDAILAGNTQAINYFVAQKYVDALKDIAAADNQKVMFLPLEATSLLGSLGGIGEIAKETFKTGGDKPS